MNRIWKYQDYVDRLSHSSKYVRRWAFFALEKQFPRRCAPEAAQLIDDPDDILALEAPGYLARRGAVEFAPAILESFLHSSGNRARASVKALGVMRYEAAFEPVVKKVFSGGRMEHLEFLGFVEYLGCTRTEESRAILRRLLVETSTRKDLPFNEILTNLAAHQDPLDIAVILDALRNNDPILPRMDAVFGGIMKAIGVKAAYDNFNAYKRLDLLKHPSRALDEISSHYPALRIDPDIRAIIVENFERGLHYAPIKDLLSEAKKILGNRYEEGNIPDFLASSYKKDRMAEAFMEQIDKTAFRWRIEMSPPLGDETRCLFSAFVTAFMSIRGRGRYFKALDPDASGKDLVDAVRISGKDMDEKIEKRLTALAPIDELKSAFHGDLITLPKIHIARIMGRIGDLRFVPDLLRVLLEADSNTYIFEEALRALHGIDEAGHESILKAIENEELKDISTAFLVLPHLPYAESFDIATRLRRKCEDNWEFETDKDFCYCLRDIGDPRGMDFLRMSLNEYNTSYYGECIETLCELHNRYVHELDAIREARAAAREKHVQSRENIAALADILKKRHKDQNRTPVRKISQTPTTTGKKRKIGRNAPCPCGSGKKYKKCCLN